jgi:hypothetical protein
MEPNMNKLILSCLFLCGLALAYERPGTSEDSGGADRAGNGRRREAIRSVGDKLALVVELTLPLPDPGSREGEILRPYWTLSFASRR